MDDLLLTIKSCEYIYRIYLAEKKEDSEKLRAVLRKSILVERLLARNAVEQFVSARNDTRAFVRSVGKAKEQGIRFAFGAEKRSQMRADTQKAREHLSAIGQNLCVLLDMWQNSGATLKELCNICNRSYTQLLAQLGPTAETERFSSLFFVHNLDYKDPRNRGWIDYEVDAPLTHAVKEHWVDVICNTAEGKAASRAAVEGIFPEIAKNAMTIATDADGETHLVDKDGYEIWSDYGD